MPDIKKNIIPTETVTARFAQHLSIEGNKRILISAPFGSGKTFFLQQFFQPERKTLNITLHPIDYSVASNEDIFELIKHDILIELMDKYIEDLKLEKDDFSRLLILQEYVRNKMDIIGFVKSILSKFSSTAEAVVENVEAVKTTIDEFKKFEDSVKIDEEQKIINYVSELKLKTGSIRENDGITAFIKDFVKRIKDTNKDQKFVLILDDLDRLDPDHVFRLFNLFTAHHDSKTDENKFDFDQVIFVCDINNIHHMFIHKYGAHVDFSGYIDKFYSSYIFNFDFKRFLFEKINDLLQAKIDFDKEFGKDGADLYLHEAYNIKKKGTNFSESLMYVIRRLVHYEQIRIRNFERFQSYTLPNYQFTLFSGMKQNVYEFPFLVMMCTFQQFFPRINELETAMENLSKKFDSDYSSDGEQLYFNDEGIIRLLISESLPFILPEKDVFHRDTIKGGKTYQLENELGNLVSCNVIKSRGDRLKLIEMNVEKQALDEEKKEITVYERVVRPNPFWFLLKGLKGCIERGYLRI